VETYTDTGTTRQIVFRYWAGLSGTGDFAVWHLGTTQVTFYMPEGTVRRMIDLPRATELDAQLAAETHGEITSRHYSANIYPREN
jgi:hypothetical protein